MSHTSYHEPTDRLTEKTQDMHRALVSLQEELEAVDWYQQRVDAAKNTQLQAILAHNMEEEIEHAAMVLEWLRRNHAGFAKHLKTYLFTDADITAIEEEDTSGASSDGPPPPPSNSRRRTIGALGRDR